jgi:hypothetical protein
MHITFSPGLLTSQFVGPLSSPLRLIHLKYYIFPILRLGTLRGDVELSTDFYRATPHVCTAVLT